MRKALTICSCLAFACLLSASENGAPAGKQERTFRFTYTAAVKDVPEGAKSVDLWIPVPQSTADQSINDLELLGSGASKAVPPEIALEPVHNNKMAHWRLDAAGAKGFVAKMSFLCIRKEVAARDRGKARELTEKELAELSQYLRPDKLVLVGGEFAERADNATRGARNPGEIAKAAYDYTVSTMRYDKRKDKPGWGHGSTQWACDARFGNCTDFHALFMSIARSKGIPVKFEMGFPLPLPDPAKPETLSGHITGYHCWAKFYLAGVGWVPVDAFEGYKRQELKGYFFGNLDAHRVQFTNGRDTNLSPRQAGEPLNYFIYPYAEADGKPFAVEGAYTFSDAR